MNTRIDPTLLTRARDTIARHPQGNPLEAISLELLAAVAYVVEHQETPETQLTLPLPIL